MDVHQIKLETKLVKDISGTFIVPSYQRGYRWGTEEVKRLLDDICQNGRKPYCLQPIVVRKTAEDHYELIDGQQRLTTLYLIYRFLYQLSPGYYDAPQFSLRYETRVFSEDFLKTMDRSKRNDNIDFCFMANAYDTIEQWFAAEKRTRDRIISECFDLYTKVIWYEVGEHEDAISLFTRLNIGKIPLTSAELVKAMFLSGHGKLDRERQEEIALQWDNLERALHDDSLWFFLTNRSARFQTKIDLILDLVAEKPADSRDVYHTFFRIDEFSKTMTPQELWRKIQQTFLTLRDWHENHELYHKIGYLIASGKRSLLEIYLLSKGKTKREFRGMLDQLIRESIAIKGNYADLSYEKPQDYRAISTLLLLFNVESVRLNGEQTQWFPFDKYKNGATGNVAWSLEHIHAQNSEGLRTQEQWREWLRLHIPSVRSVSDDRELITKMQAAVDDATLGGSAFKDLQSQVVERLSSQGSAEFLHSIGNLALLRSDDNAALNNSTFDVKRNRIVQMDREGQYIPFCTKMVFLKYYTPSENNQLHFWGQVDRAAYVKEINRVLAPYLSEPIAAAEEV